MFNTILLTVDAVDILGYVILAILSLLIWFSLVRWAVRANNIIRNQQAMIYFMILQCKKMGVPDEEIRKLKEYFQIK